MHKPVETELKVGLFVTIGLGLVMLAILILGSTEGLLTSKSHYYSYFESVEGLIPGAKVVIGGIQVGTVDDIRLDKEKRNVRVQMSVEKSAREWIRKDSESEIVTQGVLGDKFIQISIGTSSEPELPPQSEIPIRPSKDLTQFLSKGDQLMASLTSIASSIDRLLKAFETRNRSEIFFEGMAESAKNLSLLTDKINRQLDLRPLTSILQKIDNGTGTVGALINDPRLYDDAKALVGEINQNRIVRNLVRETIKKSEETDAAKKKPGQ